MRVESTLSRELLARLITCQATSAVSTATAPMTTWRPVDPLFLSMILSMPRRQQIKMHAKGLYQAHQRVSARRVTRLFRSETDYVSLWNMTPEPRDLLIVDDDPEVLLAAQLVLKKAFQNIVTA